MTFAPGQRVRYRCLAGSTYDAAVHSVRPDGTADLAVECPGVAEPVALCKIRRGEGPGQAMEREG